MARVIAVCNQKGGVGKTTTAVNLGSYLAAFGRKVLLVDFDPQANASSALGYLAPDGGTIYHGVLGAMEPRQLIRPTMILNCHFIPSANHLSGALVELVNLPEREYFLKKFIDKVKNDYDYILIDLPPTLSLLMLNGLLASGEVIIPVQAEYYSLEGLSQLLSTLELVRNNLDHDLKVAGALITMYDKWEHLSQEVAKNIRRNFPHYVFEVEIPRSVSLAEAPSFGKPILIYAPYSQGALAYRRLATEVMRQENLAWPETISGSNGTENNL
ncbi:MAG: ParA family protein [Patescibacteria group bacterium]|nr:ParA family protein [Patescibacteria group bacterium]MCL5262107.1 ParA family protein [Patescibacteria group bacterium]